MPEAAWESDFLSTHPKDAERFRHTSCGQDKISHCQHGQKTKHGLMKAPYHCDDVEKDTASHHSYDVDHTVGNASPHMELLQAWDSHQKEGPRVVTAHIKDYHGRPRCLLASCPRTENDNNIQHDSSCSHSKPSIIMDS